MNVWRLITHHEFAEDALNWAKRTHRIGIGWGEIGNIKAMGYTSARDISRAIARYYPHLDNAGQGGASLYHFCFTMKPDDLVILSTGSRRALVMQVTGPYQFKGPREVESIGEYEHQRSAIVVPIDPNVLWQEAGSSPAEGFNVRWPLIKCLKTIDAKTKAASGSR